MSTSDIYKVLEGTAPMGQDQAYWDKQIHDVPLSKVVDREKFILERCKGKKVLNLGCASGKLHERIKSVAVQVCGVDQEEPADVLMDLDYIKSFSGIDFEPEAVIAGEVIEHLVNPGGCLHWLAGFNVPLIVTLPNAHADANASWTRKGKENVNRDHVAWYSFNTAKALFDKTGWSIREFYWYNGKPRTAEGLIFVLEVDHGAA